MSVVICKKCGLVQTNPRMTLKSYYEFYNSEYRKLLDATDEIQSIFREHYAKGKLIYEYIKTVMGKPIENGFVVEIGTSTGGILKFFQERGNEVFGLDLGEKYIEFGKEKGLNLKVGTVEKLSELDRKPDLVILSHVVEHFLNPIKELEKITQYLKPESLIYIEVPGIRNLPFQYNQDFLEYLQIAHTYHFTLESLINCCQKVGLELISGNVSVHSLFKVGKKNNYRSDYDSTINFLKELENAR